MSLRGKAVLSSREEHTTESMDNSLVVVHIDRSRSSKHRGQVALRNTYTGQLRQGALEVHGQLPV